jgi:short-subunit dehydrogenase
MNIKDKVIIVTGASSGIGEACAKLLGQKGGKVVLASRSTEKLNEIAQNLSESLVIPTDTTKPKDIENLISKTMKKFGRIDILINNAGRGYSSMVESIDIQKLQDLFQLNFVGPLIAMQLVIPIMRNQKSGSIVNISSGTALMAIPGLAAYSSTKRALVGLSLTAQEELKKDNIKVSIVYPYITETNFYKNTLQNETRVSGESGHIWKPDPPADSSEYVAEKIFEVIQSGAPEMYVHDWMKK